ncbi:MAG: hypothetical protein EOS13_29415 [Mesorhizobium sp.]|nr:MAG: hypothetical protein EOS13_29415 [Mesorhizobium sp.]
MDPFDGSLYVFRSKRADRVKIVWWDGSGVCLYAKTLQKRSRNRSFAGRGSGPRVFG